MKYTPDKPHKREQTKESVEKKLRAKRQARRGVVVARFKLYIFCFLGVIAHKTLDLVGQTINFRTLSVGYVALAVVISVVAVKYLEKNEVPEDTKPAITKKIFQRMALKAALLGYFWQTLAAKLEEMIR